MSKQVLMSERLVLLPACPDDLDMLWALWRDPEVRRYLFDDQAVSREQAQRMLQDSLLQAETGLGLWLVYPWGNAPALGCVGLLRSELAALALPGPGQAVETLAAFRPEHWGHGYAHEALKTLVQHAFDALGLSSLSAVCDVPNRMSDRLLRRLGFEPGLEADGPRHRLRLYRLDADANRSSHGA